METRMMRIRCPKDAPREADRHLAVDVRLPLTLDAIPRLLRGLGRCPCGADMAIDTREVAAHAAGEVCGG